MYNKPKPKLGYLINPIGFCFSEILFRAFVDRCYATHITTDRHTTRCKIDIDVGVSADVAKSLSGFSDIFIAVSVKLVGDFDPVTDCDHPCTSG